MKKITITKDLQSVLTSSPSIDFLKVYSFDNKTILHLSIPYTNAFGFGEKFDSVDQIGNIVDIKVREKCFNQGNFTYFTYSFMMTPNGFGIYLDTLSPATFDLTKTNEIEISFVQDALESVNLYIFYGPMKEIMTKFMNVVGKIKLFPKWTLGGWASSNRWENDQQINEVIKRMNETSIPHNVLVIERWSDLTTFYNFMKSSYEIIKGDEYHNYEDFDFSNALFKDPKALIAKLNNLGIHVILWDLPVYASKDSVESTDIRQRMIDNEYVLNNSLCLLKSDGAPYTIPNGNWFQTSFVPDFTNNQTKTHWFSKRKYLLDAGIEGFKCDGGEFIYEDDIVSSNGLTGNKLKNHYSSIYIKSYDESELGIIYARSGDEFTPSHAIMWAGDQESTWDELRHILVAILSSSLSGVCYHTFDISGFSGQCPTKSLYLRSIELATFTPIMQWHSDPISNGGFDHSNAYTKNNDRSPWNISDFYKDESIIDICKFYFDIHYALIPYIYNLCINAHNTKVPAVRHLAYEFEDSHAINCHTEFMLGDSLLICPVLEDYINTQNVYLPSGTWYNFFTFQKVEGGYHEEEVRDDYIPVFIRSNSCIPLNLQDGSDTFITLLKNQSNDLSKYNKLTFLLNGCGEYLFLDDLKNVVHIKYNNGLLDVLDDTTYFDFNIIWIGDKVND